MKRVADLAGGIGGLASASYILEIGLTPTIFWTRAIGYLRRRRRSFLGASRVPVGPTTRVHPHVTAWNTSIGLARATVAALAKDLS